MTFKIRGFAFKSRRIVRVGRQAVEVAFVVLRPDPMAVNVETAAVEVRDEPRAYPAPRNAAANGQVAMLRYLISSGADPSKKDYNGGTALHSAAASGSVPVVNVLLAAGCDPDAVIVTTGIVVGREALRTFLGLSSER